MANENFVVRHGLIVCGDVGIDTHLGVSGNTSVGGTLKVDSNTDLNGTLDVCGNTSVGGTLKVDNNSDLNGTLDVSGNTSVGGGLTVTGATDINSTLDISGNTSVGGGLTVTGATDINSTLDISGNTTVGGGLTVTGNSDLNGTLDVCGNTSVGGGLTVTGNSDLNGTLDVNSNTSVGGGLTVTGNSDLNGTLDVNSNTSVGGTLKVDNNSDLNGTLDVSGNTTVGGGLTVTGATDINNTLDVNSNTSLGGNLTVTGNSDLNGTLDISGNTSVGGGLTVTGNSDLNGTLGVCGNTSLGGNLTVIGTTCLEDNTEIHGSLTVSHDGGGGGLGANEKTLTVKGDASFDATIYVDTLTVQNHASISGNLVITGVTNLNSILGVSGNTSVGGGLTVTGAVDLNSTLDVCGNASVGGTLDVSGNTTVGGGLTVTDAVDLNSTLDVNSNTSVGGGLTVTGATDLNSTLDVNNNVSFGGNLTVIGTISAEDIDVSGSVTTSTLTVCASATISGDTQIKTRLTVGSGHIGSRNPGFSVIADNNSSPIVAKVGQYNTTFSVLPWSGGETYIASGVYYDDGTWVHASPNDHSAMVQLTPNGGLVWYSSSNSSTSWNVANAVSFLNNSGQLDAPLSTNVTYNGNTIWHAGNDGSSSGLDADTVDGQQRDNLGATLATYGTTGSASGRVRCTAPFNTNSGHMFQITISLYGSYTIETYVVGGYMYSTTNQWHSPTCIYTGGGNNSPDIKVGRDSSGKAYISVANRNYMGVRVHNMTRGYATSVADTYDPWTITIDAGTENSVSPTTYENWHSGNDGSGSGLDADTLDSKDSSFFFKSYSGSTGGWEDSNRNFLVRSGGDAVGLCMDESDGTFGFQLYGNSGSYGFLQSNWGSWDIRKTVNGQMYLKVSGTEYTVYHNGNLPSYQTASTALGYITAATGNYGTIRVDDGRGVTWGGYAIRDDWVLMSSGAATVGIYNDTDNKWSILCRQNAEVELYYNDAVQAETASGYLLANNQCRSPIFYDSGNTAYYFDGPSTTFAGYYGRRAHHTGHLVGSYNSVAANATKSNPIYTIGSSYNPSDAALGNMYGIGYTNYGASFISLSGASDWGMYVAADGDARIWLDGTTGRVIGASDHRGTLFYDISNTGYYCDPASTSRMGQIQANTYQSPYNGSNSSLARSSYPYAWGFQESGAWSGTYPDLVLHYHTGVTLAGYKDYGGITFKYDYNSDSVAFRANGGGNYNYSYTWLQVNPGIYSSTNGAHFYTNSTSSYGSWYLTGTRNGYTGILFAGSAQPHLMFDSAGNGGFYNQNGGSWHYYYNISNACVGINDSGTSASYGLYVTGGIYSSSGNIYAASDARVKKDIKTIENALDKVLNLRGVTYIKTNKTEDDLTNGKTEMGVIAQEVLEVVPEVVNYAEDVDIYAVDYGNFAGLFIEAIKEQNEVINNLRQEILNLKNQLGM